MTSRKLSPEAQIEKSYPLLLSALFSFILALVIHWVKFYPFSQVTISNILFATVDFSAITIGFLVTALSILPSLEEKQVIKALKKNGSYENLINYIYDSARNFLCLVLLSMMGFLINFDTPQSWYYWASIVWIFIFSLSIFSYYRAISLFISILKD